MSAKTINGLHFSGTVFTTTVDKAGEQLTDEFVVLDRFEITKIPNEPPINNEDDLRLAMMLKSESSPVMHYLVMAKSTGLTHIIAATELTGCTCTSLHKKQDDRDN